MQTSITKIIQDLRSRYLTEYKSSIRGRSELRSLSFGPFSNNEDLVFKVIDILEGYTDQFTASTQPESHVSLPTHIAQGYGTCQWHELCALRLVSWFPWWPCYSLLAVLLVKLPRTCTLTTSTVTTSTRTKIIKQKLI